MFQIIQDLKSLQFPNVLMPRNETRHSQTAKSGYFLNFAHFSVSTRNSHAFIDKCANNAGVGSRRSMRCNLAGGPARMASADTASYL